MDRQHIFFTSTVHCFGRFTEGHWDYWAFGLSGPRTIGLSLGFRTIGPSDYWAFGLSGLRTIGLLDYRAFRLLGLRTIGPSDYWAFGLSGDTVMCWSMVRMGRKLESRNGRISFSLYGKDSPATHNEQ